MIPKSLTVLHLKQYNNQGHDQNLLADFRDKANPFAPMTCARHVYISLDALAHMPDNFLPTIEQKTTVCQLLTGIEAYRFLLRWFVGAISSKLQGNDHFVLGQVRKHWTKFSKENDIAPELNQIISLLFKDAKNIRHNIQNLEIDSKSKREVLNRMCENCTQSRASGQKPIYENLLAGSHEYIAAAEEELFRTRLGQITQTLRILNTKAEDDNLAPSDFKENARTPLVGMFRRNMSLAFEKKMVTAHAIERSKRHSII
tara:strand:+ start:133525 stop:134298 length:774 start_codon:yes stop_codon:yes gene_type:complete